jgi:hypothetical protein
MQQANDRSDAAKRNLRALVLTAVLFGATMVAFGACGDGDLGFPGSIPPTQTAAATATPDPDEN